MNHLIRKQSVNCYISGMCSKGISILSVQHITTRTKNIQVKTHMLTLTVFHPVLLEIVQVGECGIGGFGWTK